MISLTDVIIAAALKAAPSFDNAATILRKDHPELAVKEIARAELLRALAADDEIAERLAGALREVKGSPLLLLVTLREALQWLLDDMNDADETHSESGVIYDSVEEAAASLVEAGGVLNWYSPEDAAAYKAKEEAKGPPPSSAN